MDCVSRTLVPFLFSLLCYVQTYECSIAETKKKHYYLYIQLIWRERSKHSDRWSKVNVRQSKRSGWRNGQLFLLLSCSYFDEINTYWEILEICPIERMEQWSSWEYRQEKMLRNEWVISGTLNDTWFIFVWSPTPLPPNDAVEYTFFAVYRIIATANARNYS